MMVWSGVGAGVNAGGMSAVGAGEVTVSGAIGCSVGGGGVATLSGGVGGEAAAGNAGSGADSMVKTLTELHVLWLMGLIALIFQ